MYLCTLIDHVDYNDVDDLVNCVTEKSKRSSMKQQQQQDHEKKQTKKNSSQATHSANKHSMHIPNDYSGPYTTEDMYTHPYRLQDPTMYPLSEQRMLHELDQANRFYAAQHNIAPNSQFDPHNMGHRNMLDTPGLQHHSFPSNNAFGTGVDLDINSFDPESLSPTLLTQVGVNQGYGADTSLQESGPVRAGRKKARDFLNADAMQQQQYVQQSRSQQVQNARRRKHELPEGTSFETDTFGQAGAFQQGEDKKAARRGPAAGNEKRTRKPSVKVMQAMDDGMLEGYDEFGLPLTTPHHAPRSLKKRLSKAISQAPPSFPSMNPYGQTMPSGLTPHLGGMNLYQSPGLVHIGSHHPHNQGLFTDGPSPMLNQSGMDMVSPDFFGQLPETPFSSMLERSGTGITPHSAVFDHTGFTPTDPSAPVHSSLSHQHLSQQQHQHNRLSQRQVDAMGSQGSTEFAGEGQPQDEDGDSDFSLSPSLFTSPKVPSSAMHNQFNQLANSSFGDLSFSKMNSPDQLLIRSNLGNHHSLGSPIPINGNGLTVLADGCVESARKDPLRRAPLSTIPEDRNGRRDLSGDHGADEFSNRLLSSNMINDSNILISAVKAPRQHMLDSSGSNSFVSASDLRSALAGSALKPSVAKVQRERSPENKENEDSQGHTTTATKKKRVEICDERDYSYIEAHTYARAGVSPDMFDGSYPSNGALSVRFVRS